MTPILLLTRPAGRNASFAAAVQARWQQPLGVVTSPLIKIAFADPAPPAADVLIFTSANGVAAARFWGLPPGVPAWCVGGHTAAAAQEAGYTVRVGPGDAAGLVSDILAARPSGRFAHIRGRHARGAIAQKLTQAGLACADVIAYDQIACDLGAEACTALAGDQPVIAPLFSPRTATILRQQGPFAAPVHAVVISDAAAEALGAWTSDRLTVAATPDASGMADAVIAALAGVAPCDR